MDIAESSHYPDFSGGRVVIFYLTNTSTALSGGVVLEYAEFTWLGDRLFVVGRSPTIPGNEWLANLPSSVAWESVQHYVVFSSREELSQRLAMLGSPSLLKRMFPS